MIKNRSFMFGLGFGLLLGAILLQLMITADIQRPTKEHVIEDAAKLNLKVIAESDKLLTKEEWDALKEQGTEPVDETGSTAPSTEPTPTSIAPSPSPVVAPKAAVNPDGAVAPSAPSTPKNSSVKQPETRSIPTAERAVSLRIPNGSTLTDVANLLTQSGVIQDKEKFLRTAAKRGATKVIQYGKYSFNTDESFDIIIDKITTKKY